VNLARQTLIVVGTAALVAVVLTLAWLALDAILLAFGGVVLAIFLRALADWVGRHVGLGSTWSLVAVIIGLLVLLGAGAWVLAGQLADQVGELSARLPAALRQLQSDLAAHSWGRALLGLLGHVFSRPGADTVVPAVKGAVLVGGRVVADTGIALVLAVLLAANPTLYVGGLLRLFPVAMRTGARATLGRVAQTLRWWMLAQLTLMLVLGSAASTGLWLIGAPIPLALGAATGVLLFVPYLGALAAWATTAIIALAVSPQLALEASAVYLGIHVLEGYVLTPVLHWNIVLVPPALTLLAQAVLFAAVGLPGVFLATPIVASLRVLVLTIYVEGLLEAGTARG